jgi:glycine oxidase
MLSALTDHNLRVVVVKRLAITVVGAGALGLWQAFELARRGHLVTLREALPETATGAASRYAGAMLAPFCEREGAEPIVQQLGLRGLELWRQAYPGVSMRGTLVVAASRDHGELMRFARLTQGHRQVTGAEIAALEPDLAGRFASGLFYSGEAHLAPRPALQFLVGELRRLGAEARFNDFASPPTLNGEPRDDVVIDCRGMAARDDLPSLRGVRGEMAVVRAPEVRLSRPIRLLHPRFPLYLVPWGDGIYMAGATVIEREDAGPVTLRSALDLLGTAYAIDPAFGEAEIIELSAAVRPSFPDNVPKAVVRGRRVFVNGAHRHGFLLAPVLAEAVADFLACGAVREGIVQVES